MHCTASSQQCAPRWSNTIKAGRICQIFHPLTEYARTPACTFIRSNTTITGHHMPLAGHNEPLQQKISISSKDESSTIFPILLIYPCILGWWYHSGYEGHVPGGAILYVVGAIHQAFSSGHSTSILFIVRGNCKKGMLRHMGMTPLYYSALLMAAGLIRFKGSTVCFQRDECSDSFFGSSQYGLLGPSDKPNNGASEFPPVRVLANSFKYQHGPLDKTSEEVKNFVIQIGSYDEHQNIVAAEKINKNTSPPDFHHKLHVIQW